MKRLFLSASALVFLVSCTQAGSLPPAEVLQKATDATQALMSAAFTVDMDFQGKTELMDGTWDGNGHVNGIMTNAGKQVQFSLSAKGKSADAAKQETAYNLSSDLIIADENEIYLQLHTFDITPPSRLLPPELLTRLLNQWWLIPNKNAGANNPADLSPDPSLLKMQMSVISVTKDHGLAMINGRSAYRYDVTIDPIKFKAYLAEVAKNQGNTEPVDDTAFADMNATGTVWIDADSFFIHRVLWTISSTNPAKPFILHIDAMVTDHNKPQTISLPANAAPFPGTSGQGIFNPSDSSGSLTPSTR